MASAWWSEEGGEAQASVYVFIYLFITPINKKGARPPNHFFLCLPPTLGPISLSSKRMAGIGRQRRKNLKSRYLHQELLLEGGEAQCIMGEMPIRVPELELIPCMDNRGLSLVASGMESHLFLSHCLSLPKSGPSFPL